MINLFSLALFILLLLVFLQAVLHKLFDVAEFRGFVADYQLLPERWVSLASNVFIGLEAMVVLLSLTAIGRSVALVVAILLLSLYGMAIVINLLRGRQSIECGCGGAVQSLGWHLVVRNLCLMAFALVPLFYPPEYLGVMEIVFAVGAGFYCWLIYQFAERAGANWQLIKHALLRGRS